jgi:hypothetical protein
MVLILASAVDLGTELCEILALTAENDHGITASTKDAITGAQRVGLLDFTVGSYNSSRIFVILTHFMARVTPSAAPKPAFYVPQQAIWLQETACRHQSPL